MRRLCVALTVALILVVPRPTTAVAVPVAPLCTPDAARGGVPAGFLLNACVDASSMTVRNDLDVPVVVRREGDAGEPVPVHGGGGRAATMLQLLAGTDELLMPGDVVRWPLGPAPGTLTVTDVDPVTVAVVHSIEGDLPRPGADGEAEHLQSFAAVVRETAAAVTERALCVKGKNFLQVTACDVEATSAVGAAVTGHLPHPSAAGVLPVVLDAAAWTTWSPSRPSPTTAVDPSRRVLSQVAVPAPIVAPPPEVPPPVVPPPVDPPVVRPPVPQAPAPAAVPPVPTPPQAPVPAPAPGFDWRAWLQALAARAAAQDGGNGHGHGQGD